MWKMRILSILFFLTCLTVSAQHANYHIQGQLEGYPEGFLVKLYDLSKGTNILMDSTDLKNGKFSFKGPLPLGYQLMAIMDIRKIDKGYSMDYKKFWVDSNTLTFEGKFNDLTHAKVSGNVLNEDESELFRLMDQQPNNHIQVVQDFGKKNPNSLIAIKYLALYAHKMDKKTLKEYFDLFDLNPRNSIFGQEIQAHLKSDIKNLKIGDQAPDFTLPNKEGKKISLSQYKGKYVLLDFWGSWCNPCRLENKNLVKLYKEFHPKGFDILGVSIEGTREAWLGSMEEDQVTWESLSDLNMDKTEPVRLYSVHSYPTNFLISPNGKIIDKNLRGEELQKKLKELMK